MASATIGVFGGSGFYEFLEGAERVRVDTPFGEPSDDLVIGELRGRRVAFVARHGKGHRFPPHRVPYRANLWALRSVGVRQVLAPCAVGSLRRELGLADDQGKRYSWGYPSCPDLAQHALVDRLLDAEAIGVCITEGFQFDPEQTTAALVVAHPDARYFALARSGGGGPLA